MKLTRRGFFGFLAGAAAFVASPLRASPRFTLWGDGVHNDGPALGALLRGEGAGVAFMPGAGSWHDGVVWLTADRTYRLDEPVIIGSGASGLTLDGNGAELLVRDNWGFQIGDCENVTIRNLLITGNGENGGLDIRSDGAGGVFNMEKVTVRRFHTGLRTGVSSAALLAA